MSERETFPKVSLSRSPIQGPVRPAEASRGSKHGFGSAEAFLFLGERAQQPFELR